MSNDAYRQLALREMGLTPLWVRRESTAQQPACSSQTNQLVESASSAITPITQEQDFTQRRQTIADLSWDQLSASVRNCQACGLCKTRTQTVLGGGITTAPWMLVGEAPGAEEDARGEPFVGQAGRLLDNMLASIGLSRQKNVYIANVLKCRPPNNRNPEAEEVSRCEPYLMRQIDLVQPRLIVVLGRFAAQSLLNTDISIAKLRGRAHPVQFGERTIPVIVTYHPAYLLRNLIDKAKSWEDLVLARTIMNHQAAGALG